MYCYSYCNVNVILFNQCNRKGQNITGFSLLTGLCLPLIIFYRVSLLRSTKKVTGILFLSFLNPEVGLFSVNCGRFTKDVWTPPWTGLLVEVFM